MPLTRVSLKDWVRLNLKIGALSFGGSGRLLLYEDGVVRDNPWMTREEFQVILTMSQVLPGPNLVNLAVYLGLALNGAWASLLGLVALTIPGALVVVAIVAFLNMNQPDVRLIFQGFSMASVMLFAIFVVSFFKGLKKNDQGEVISKKKYAGRLLVALAVGAATFELLPLTWILIGGGGAGFFVETFL